MTVNVSMQDILQPIALTKVISQMAAVSPSLLHLFGMEPGGKNEIDLGLGRMGYYHVYNNVRTVGQGRAPRNGCRAVRAAVHRKDPVRLPPHAR